LPDRPLRAMLIVPVVLRGIVIPAALTDGPLRAAGIVVITAVRPAADRGLRIDSEERQGAHCERRRDQIFREIFHRFLHL
jgi:hypothetical protein